MMRTLSPTSVVVRLRNIYEQHQRNCHLALILLCGLIAYSNSFRVPFYFDDFPCIAQNPIVRQFSLLFDLGNYREFGLTEDLRNSLATRVVTYATFALNYRLHGFSLPGFHLVNLAIHLANALLVYELIRVTAAGCREEDSHSCVRDNSLALIVTLLFVLHPVQTNAVTYIVQRFSSLATFFYLASLLAYIHAVLATDQRRWRIFYSLSLLTALLAMFTKEIAFTLPVLIALYDIAFLPGERRQRWRRLAPLAATMSLLPLTAFWLAAISKVTKRNFLQALDLASQGDISQWDYFFTQWRVIVTYLRLMIFPADLNLDYDYPLYSSPSEPAVLFSGLFLLALLMVGFYLLFFSQQKGSERCGEWKLAGFGLSWFFITLSMESSIITLDDLIQEYRLYLPSCGLILAAVVAVNQLRRRLTKNIPYLDRAVVILTLLVVVALGVTTFARNQVWQDEVRFWEDSLRNSPDKARPHINLAAAYGLRQRFGDARKHAIAAKTGNGHLWLTHYQLAKLFNKLGDDESAIAEMREAIRLSPKRASFHGIIGQLYINTGEIPAAVAAFQRAIELDPGYSEARANLKELEILNQQRLQAQKDSARD